MKDFFSNNFLTQPKHGIEKSNMVKKLICKLNGHDFNEWEFIAPDSCVQKRACARDGYEEHRQVPHNFGIWNLAPDSCVQKRACARDGYEEHRQVPHNFGEWKYTNSGQCDQVRICIRDGHQQSRVIHDFNDWKYKNKNSCEKHRVCKRGGHTEVDKSHDWSEWYYKPSKDEGSCLRKRHCNRCLEEETVEETHDFRPTQIYMYDVHQVYKCSKCGADNY